MWPDFRPNRLFSSYIAKTKALRDLIEASIFTGETLGLLNARAQMSNTNERYVSSAESRHQTLAYLSRYLFWLVIAVLFAGFSLVV